LRPIKSERAGSSQAGVLKRDPLQPKNRRGPRKINKRRQDVQKQRRGEEKKKGRRRKEINATAFWSLSGGPGGIESAA